MHSRTVQYSRSHRVTKLSLLCGFLALLGAILRAYTRPPTGYELSIYAGTPLTFWVGIGVAVVIAALVAFCSAVDRYMKAGVFLGGTSMTAVLGLPLLRGYAFYGRGDAMTHLGWVRDVSMGRTQLESLLYPGLHSVAVFIHNITGNAVDNALLLAVLSFSVVFFVFVPLVVRTAVGTNDVLPIAGFSAFLLLPITNLSTYVSAHPYTQTVLYSTFVIYLALRFIFEPGDRFVTPYGLLLGLACVVLVLSHPLQALNTILLFAGVVVVQFFYRTQQQVAGYRSLVFHTGLLTICFLLWTTGKQTFEEASRSYPRAVLSFIRGAGDAGAAIAAQSGSLLDIGVSPQQLFLKIFAVSALYSILAGGFIFVTVHGRLRSQLAGRDKYLNYTLLGVVALVPLGVVFGLKPVYISQPSTLLSNVTAVVLVFSAGLVGLGIAVVIALMLLAKRMPTERSPSVETDTATITYLTVGIAFVSPLFFVFFIGSIAELYWRILGFIFVLITLLGAIALGYLGQAVASWSTPRITRTALVVLFVIILPVSLMGVFPSPYIYQANKQVTANSLDGFETTFNYHDESVPLAGVRSGHDRFLDGINGVSDRSSYTTNISGENMTRLPAVSSGPTYLVVTQFNREREIKTYRGLRYTRAQFDSVEQQAGVDLVQSTGEYKLYLAR